MALIAMHQLPVQGRTQVCLKSWHTRHSPLLDYGGSPRGSSPPDCGGWPMRIRKHKASLAIPALLILAAVTVPALNGSAAVAAQPVPTPESVLGWKPCTDYKLSNYDQIADYFRVLANASNRMKVVDLGKTSEGVDQIMAIISSPQNLTKQSLAKYAQISRQLSNVSVTDSVAHDLASQGKTIDWLDYGIHSTEVAPTQSAPQFAYDLLTSESDEVKSIRDNVITLLVLNTNPDGTNHVSNWYMDHVGGPFQDTTYPQLYQKYAGHDDN